MRPTATSGEAVAGRGLDLAAATAMRPAAAVVEIPAEAVAIAQVVPIPEPVAPAVAAGPANVPPVDVPRLEPVAFADVKPFVNTDLAPAPIQVAEEKVVAVAIVPDKIDKPREIVKVEIPKHIARPGCKNFGTFVDFVRSPQLASREAKDDSKLVFLLHVSGDFDDDAFT